MTMRDAHALEVALDLYSMYLHRRGERVDAVLALELLTQKCWIDDSGKSRRATMTKYHWAELAEHVRKKDPELAIRIATFVLDKFGSPNRFFTSHDARLMAFLTTLLSGHPDEMWAVVLPKLGPPLDARSFELRQWLGGSGFWDKTPGALSSESPDIVWNWVDENIEDRAWVAAGFVPTDLLDAGGRFSKELLARYGDREDVRRNLLASYFTEGWSGDESEYRKSQLDRVSAAKERADDPRVRKWLSEYEDALRFRQTRAKIEEEREDW